MQDGKRILSIRFPNLQPDPAEYMRMPTSNAKHVLILREALDVR